MHIKCVHNISHAGINGQKMQGTTGGKQTLCLDETRKDRRGQDMSSQTEIWPEHMDWHENLHQNLNRHFQGLIISALAAC